MQFNIHIYKPQDFRLKWKKELGAKGAKEERNRFHSCVRSKARTTSRKHFGLQMWVNINM